MSEKKTTLLKKSKIKLAIKKIAEFQVETGHTLEKTKQYFAVAFDELGEALE